MVADPAHSAERWLQFQYAYALDLEFRSKHPGRWAVGCECQFVDIVVAEIPSGDQRDTPIWDRKAAAKLELKVNGNWYTIGNTFSDIEKDLQKVDGYDVPSAALSFWFFVRPTSANPVYHWIDRQIKSRRQPPSKDWIMSKVGQGYTMLTTLKGCDDSEFSCLELYLFIHRNNCIRPNA